MSSFSESVTTLRRFFPAPDRTVFAKNVPVEKYSFRHKQKTDQGLSRYPGNDGPCFLRYNPGITSSRVY